MRMLRFKLTIKECQYLSLLRKSTSAFIYPFLLGPVACERTLISGCRFSPPGWREATTSRILHMLFIRNFFFFSDFSPIIPWLILHNKPGTYSIWRMLAKYNRYDGINTCIE